MKPKEILLGTNERIIVKTRRGLIVLSDNNLDKRVDVHFAAADSIDEYRYFRRKK